MAFSIASFLRTGQLDNPVHRAIRRHLWAYRWRQSQVAYASAVSLLVQLGYKPIMAHEICVQFNQSIDKRGSLFRSVK